MLDNFEPTPKNPTIADFFHQIGRADELGSGTRNLTKYSAMYSGKALALTEGDVFVAQVPFPWNTQIDIVRVPDTAEKVRDTVAIVPDTMPRVPDTLTKVPDIMSGVPDTVKNLSGVQNTVYQYALAHGRVSTDEISALLGVQLRRAREVLSEMVDRGLLQRVGAARSTRYVLADKSTENADQ